MKKINKRRVLGRIICSIPEICEDHVIPIELGYVKEDEKALFKDFYSFEIDQSASGAEVLERCLAVIRKPQLYTLENTVPWIELALTVELNEEYRTYAECAIAIYNAAEKNPDVDEAVGIVTCRRPADHFLFPLIRLVVFFSHAERDSIEKFSSRIRALCKEEEVLDPLARMEETKANTLTPKEVDRLLAAIFDEP